MKRHSFIFAICLAQLLITSCSTLRKTSLGVASPMFFEASAGFEDEGNWENFRLGIPANLKLLDGLLVIRPEDHNLLVAAIKGYTGYAFTVNETLYLADKFAEKDKSRHLDEALMNYSKAFAYGRQFLATEDITLQDLQKAQKEKGGIVAFLDRHLSDDEVSLEGAIYTGQALGSLANLQKHDMILVSYVSIAKGLFDWACSKNSDIGFGVCQIFAGSYEASRPRMLGGNPAKGKKIFEKFIKDRPHHWLGRVIFLENYVIPMSDERAFNKQRKVLDRLAKLHRNDLNWHPSRARHDAFVNPRLRIYQATAITRYEIIKRYRKELF
jgi:hypothetical protein